DDHRLRHAGHDRPPARRGGAAAAARLADPAGDRLRRLAVTFRSRAAAPLQALPTAPARRADCPFAGLAARLQEPVAPCGQRSDGVEQALQVIDAAMNVADRE